MAIIPIALRNLHMTDTASSSAYSAQLGTLPIYESYQRSPYLSSKHSSYFQVYSELLENYRGREITFVEVGVMDGGSLFMWRDYFGPNARIIGVEFNPGAQRWEKEGFEIHIGDQADPKFWEGFFSRVGQIDILLDDGGHTYEQQILTAHNTIPHIKDGGLLIVEDTHTSYFGEYGYPTKYSFIEWTKKIIDNINSRFPRVKVSNLPYRDSIYSVAVFESIVCFRIDRRKCFESTPTTNSGTAIGSKDFRYNASEVERIDSINRELSAKLHFLSHIPFIKAIKNWLFVRYRRKLLERQHKKVKQLF